MVDHKSLELWKMKPWERGTPVSPMGTSFCLRKPGHSWMAWRACGGPYRTGGGLRAALPPVEWTLSGIKASAQDWS